jgi:hypothetical protein
VHALDLEVEQIRDLPTGVPVAISRRFDKVER